MHGYSRMEAQSSEWVTELQFGTLYQEARHIIIAFQNPKSGKVSQQESSSTLSRLKLVALISFSQKKHILNSFR